MRDILTGPKVRFYDFQPATSDIREDILNGMQAPQKYLHPKYFYDAPGSLLFEHICQLPEYYPTRTEIGLLQKYGTQIADYIGSDTILMELGSGSSTKIRLLLDALRPSSYVPMDISRDHLIRSAQQLALDYQWLEIHAVCVDYAGAWDLPEHLQGCRRIAFFPGSSIGNFEPDAAIELLLRIAGLVGQDGGLLIGVDLIKHTDTLEKAYNDTQGVTAAFNKNLLLRLNRELSANFQPGYFRHNAFYNQARERIEMHLESTRNQIVRVAGRSFSFREAETIHTENSYKYTIAGFQKLAAYAGFNPSEVWIDPNQLFSIHYMQT